MIPSVLSVLLMGMLPVLGLSVPDLPTLSGLSIAAPSPLLARSVGEMKIDKRFSASGIIVTDFDSGQVLYERSATQRRPLASLTKLMTAVLIIEQHPDLTAWVTIPPSVEEMNGNTVSLKPGQEFTVGDLLSALLISSANDAAETLAVFHSGSAKEFVIAMNRRAAELGLKNTSFANPVGLDDTDQWSTPKDVSWLARYAFRFPVIADRLGTSTKIIRSRTGEAIGLSHTHALLHADPRVVAGKTGTTDGAGQCLMSVVHEGDRTYLVVLLGSLQRYKDLTNILDALSEHSVL
ncbi:hypothetical protein A3D88_03150 [Candidatus Peribacteria bacterium RIFCSPHIGHO2_02_FULL_52_16]|nr:MAG: hypothetical protein A2706_04840 [Candidatus Peribacteria bacterium RIFCSPHIGHO2_01_FULL_51_35]OGJ60729.1 MAG: hypothetical protein A3D88_03150 [Candidatus Peribacteria bacterium RIFCSPHIGHO2_02_FULL_52_16]